MARFTRTGVWRIRSAALCVGLAFSILLACVASAFAAAGGGASVQWRNEGFREGTGWTTGEIGPYNEGDLVPFRLTVTNSSSTKSAVVGGFSMQVTRQAHDVSVFDYTTDWSGPIAPSSQDGVSGDMLRTTFPAGMTLAPGQSATFTFKGHLALSAPGAPAAGLLNGNGVCGFSEVDADGVGAFGKRVPVKVNPRPGTLGTPAIDIAESSDAPTTGVAPGTTVTYTYVVTNVGDVALMNAVVTDSQFGAVGVIPGPLAPGASQTLTTQAILTETTEDTSSVVASDAYGREAADSAKCSVSVLSSARMFGFVYADWNANGARDADEQGMGEWLVRLTDAQGNLVATALTGADGSYEFGSLNPGVTYTLSADSLNGWQQTAPIDGVFVSTLAGGQNAGPFEFGEVMVVLN